MTKLLPMFLKRWLADRKAEKERKEAQAFMQQMNCAFGRDTGIVWEGGNSFRMGNAVFKLE